MVKLKQVAWGLIGLVILLIVFAVGFLVGIRVDEGDASVEQIQIDLGKGGRYVALGDSYSAGEGLAPWKSGTQDLDQQGDRCHRSLRAAYPLLIEFAHPTDPVFRPCSGASVANVYRSRQRHDDVPSRQGLQVRSHVEGSDVTLVTITMGGNDVLFAKVLFFCAFKDDCQDKRFAEFICYGDAESDRCTDGSLDDDTRTLREWFDESLQRLKDELTTLYVALRASFPKARILVLGYPDLMPLKAPPIYGERGVRCNIGFKAWTLPEREAFRGFGANLNRVILEATQLADEDIEYVDVASHFAGHEACGAQGEWLRFISPEILVDRSARDGLFHPLPFGQAMLARIVGCHLFVFDEPRTPRTKTTALAMTGCLAVDPHSIQETYLTVSEAPTTTEPTQGG